ncbi:glycoside hydrolase family 3 N-terminal domain-containing protein [Microcella frigidaquae]|uniref:beta-N-acetylhexosaminidase n=1 Tax=Microcella frigidaquae TaxID=424758 RepID=A0A840XME1_9MICO|nr:glycoside hydrolase family 3 N-terminal domain-containing protein [Microcella frigidaquae]MBB5617069.1 beta-N-acetylhexosaminidase [Microcella frigidaquae]NHN45274.1 glycoside hydrolase family 3 protein [Microcella frigidaquae]
MRRRRRLTRAGVVALAAALVAVTGCSAEAPPPPPPLARLVGAPAPLDPTAVYLEQRIAAMTLEQKVAALIMVHVPGTDPARIRSVIDAHGLAGVILMGDNIPGPAARVAALTGELSSEPGLPVLTAIDQEGGIVRRLQEDRFAASWELRAAPPAAAEQAFAGRSALVADAGVLINFGIVADVTPDRSSFIHVRTLGETPAAAAERVAAAVRGEQGSVLSTLKHFPGHGASPDDSHVSIPRSSLTVEEWRATHAVPFRAGIEAGAPLVMTGHLLFDRVSPLPASLSPTWITILREQLGFEGVIVTDDMLMLQRSGVADYRDPVRNAVRALAAGNDLLLYVLPADPSTVGVDLADMIRALAAAVEDGRIDEASVNASLERVLGMRRAASGEIGPYVDCGPKCRGALARPHVAEGTAGG